MELLYLYIKDDGITIKDQSFNFSSQFNFSYQPTSENAATITVTKNPNYLDHFFGKRLTMFSGEKMHQFEGYIHNVTAIIGENGVGKTNLLRYLIRLLTDNLSIGEQFIVSLLDEETKVIHLFHTLTDFTFKIEQDFLDYKIESPIEQQITYLEEMGNYYKSPDKIFEDAALIYYNPTFDTRDIDINSSVENSTYIDISTNSLISDDRINKEDVYSDDIRELTLFKSSNTRRQFDMLLNTHLANIEELNLPTEVTIRFSRSHFYPDKEKRNLDYKSEEIFKHLDNLVIDAFKDVNSQLNKLENSKNPEVRSSEPYRLLLREKIKVEFTYNLIHNFFYNLNSDFNIELKTKLDDIKGNGLFERTKDFFERQQWISGDGRPVQVIGFYLIVCKWIDEMDLNHHLIQDNSDQMITNIVGAIEIISNYEAYLNSLPGQFKKNLLTYSWRNISSGENALMDLYSRLYFAKTKRLDKIDKKKSYLYILIDEGESGFHPQWQSEYLDNLVKFVSLVFTDYHVQMILTSHSPFLASDLPKENLVFLEKQDGFCKVVEFSNGQTFAANINRLLSHQFFMKNGLIGKFAMNKINEELAALEENSNKEIDSIRITKFAKTIGEPVLSEKILEVLAIKTRS